MRACLLLVVGACGRDVQLGTAADAALPADAPIDAAHTFTARSYALATLEPVNASCEGTLTGMEANFASVTHGSVNLTDGVIDLATPSATSIRLSGAAISTTFGTPSIDLVPDPQATEPNFPSTIWDTSISGSFGTGPLATEQPMRFFGIDAATANQSVMEAAFALLFVTSDTNGDCTLSFAATLTPQ